MGRRVLMMRCSDFGAAEGHAALAARNCCNALIGTKIKTFARYQNENPITDNVLVPSSPRSGKTLNRENSLLLYYDFSNLSSTSCDISRCSSQINSIYTNPCAIMVKKRNTIPRQVTFEVRLSVPILTDKRS